LDCLPGPVSLYGWIGPCPPVEFVPPPAKSKSRHIRLKARRVAPIEYTPDSDDGGVVHLDTGHHRYEATRMQPGEEVQPYLAEIKDPDNWVMPKPPVHEVSTCSIQAIRLKKLPLDVNAAAWSANKELSDKEVDKETEYKASIVFKMNNNEDPVR
jgi:hypothetical protein